MEKLFNELRRFGCNVDEALDRVLGDKELYVDCLDSVQDDAAFYSLGAALEKGNMAASFDEAHTLKGVLGNLSLTPLYETTIKIVETLRAGGTDGLAEDYAQLMQQRQTLEDILKKHAAHHE